MDSRPKAESAEASDSDDDQSDDDNPLGEEPE